MKNDSSRRMNIYNIKEVGWSMADQRVDLVQCAIRIHERGWCEDEMDQN